MIIKYYPVIAVALMFSAATVSKADKVIQIHSYDSESLPVEFAVSEISKIHFGAGNFSVVLDEAETGGSFDLRNVSKITFAESSAVETVERAVSVHVTPNPVKDNLMIKGGEALYGSTVSLYSTTGTNVMQLSSWQGESINVSHLPAGVYIINIQSVTIKFMKL